jgi:hypothetical protein
MSHPSRLIVLSLIAGTALVVIGGQLVSAQQQSIKRTGLLKS